MKSLFDQVTAEHGDDTAARLNLMGSLSTMISMVNNAMSGSNIPPSIQFSVIAGMTKVATNVTAFMVKDLTEEQTKALLELHLQLRKILSSNVPQSNADDGANDDDKPDEGAVLH